VTRACSRRRFNAARGGLTRSAIHRNVAQVRWSACRSSARGGLEMPGPPLARAIKGCGPGKVAASTVASNG